MQISVQAVRVALLSVAHVILVSVNPVILILYVYIGAWALLTYLSGSRGVLVDGCSVVVEGVGGEVLLFAFLFPFLDVLKI